MDPTTALLVATETVTLLLGGFIALLAYRAYRRTGVDALYPLAVGVALIAAGSAASVGLHEAGLGAPVPRAVRDVATAGGFGVLLYSLYAGATTPDGTGGRGT